MVDNRGVWLGAKVARSAKTGDKPTSKASNNGTITLAS